MLEDFIVIMQKISSKDPVTLKSMMSPKLIEMLNTEINKKGRGQDEFMKSNIKSILKNISLSD